MPQTEDKVKISLPEASPLPTNTGLSLGSVMNISQSDGVLKQLFSRKLVALILVIILLVAGASFAGFHMHQNSQRRHIPTAVPSQAKAAIPGSENTLDPKNNNPSTPATAPAQKPVTASPVIKSPTPASNSVSVPTPVPTPAPVPPNTTNCLPNNPSQYDLYHIGMKNSDYLKSNSYSDTTKLYAALQFAGLLSAVDATQTVVFAPNDYIFQNNLSAAQIAWMNQSPANMRSVLGWQIVTSCITWDGVNPIQGKTGTVTLNTINGPITLTMNSPGKLENASVAIWDWFTSNGSVTFITDFVKPPQVP